MEGLYNGKVIIGSGAHIREKGAGLQLQTHPEKPKTNIYKVNIFVDTTTSNVLLIYPSGEINLKTSRMTGTLEFRKTN